MKQLVIIPAFNEERTLAGVLADLQSLPDSYEIVVINDGSQDRTAEVAAEAAAGSRLPIHRIDLPFNGGIGVAVQTGYRYALRERRFDYVIQFDADGQHDPGCIEMLVAACRANGFDLCIGSRFAAEQRGFRSTFWRRVGIRFLSWLIRVLSNVEVTDPTSGLRCAGPRAWTRFAAFYPDDYPEPEAVFWCARNRLSIGELPVQMRERQAGVSSVRRPYYIVKVSLAILVDRLRLKEYSEP